MDASSLHLNIDYVGNCGIILSPEQKAKLQTSLVILQNENKFNKVYFWGKIFGVKEDYFVAQGVGKDELAGRKTFYRYVQRSLIFLSLFDYLITNKNWILFNKRLESTESETMIFNLVISTINSARSTYTPH